MTYICDGTICPYNLVLINHAFALANILRQRTPSPIQQFKCSWHFLFFRCFYGSDQLVKMVYLQRANAEKYNSNWAETLRILCVLLFNCNQGLSNWPSHPNFIASECNQPKKFANPPGSTHLSGQVWPYDESFQADSVLIIFSYGFITIVASNWQFSLLIHNTSHQIKSVPFLSLFRWERFQQLLHSQETDHRLDRALLFPFNWACNKPRYVISGFALRIMMTRRGPTR
jgi:hypothetical protein